MSSLPYSLFIKAEGGKCNLDCHYCYYLKHEDPNVPTMPDPLLETLIRDHIDSQPQGAAQVDFIWHGGEPLLSGLAFYQQAMAWQTHYGKGKKIVNTLQTNGTLINTRWAKFFRENDFMVGVSLDGPNLFNDIARIDKQGNSSFERTMRGIQHLKEQEVPFNTLTVVNNKTYQHGKAIYQFLTDNGSDYLQFQPCIDHELDRRGEHDWTLTGQQWGRFLCDVFDAWRENDIGKVYVQFFENCLMVLMGYPSQMCHHSETCGQQLMVEANGEVFSCDHFGYDDYKLGRVQENSLRQMANSEVQLAFGQGKKKLLSAQCQRCDFLPMCQGGCPKNRLLTTPQGEAHNVLCEGYEMFFKHALPHMLRMVDAMQKGHSPAFYQLF
ncbi:TPA: anaerobic sulfatase maturase [Vibrio vulnificus]|nr:anaerobic sulfatase maturase [Vibrio vulnificus]